MMGYYQTTTLTTATATTSTTSFEHTYTHALYASLIHQYGSTI